MKNLLSQILVLTVLMPTFAHASSTGTGEDQNEQQLIQILEDDKVDLGIEEIEMLKSKVIVLDSDGNILMKALLEDAINGALPKEEIKILRDSELIFENFGDEIYVSNL